MIPENIHTTFADVRAPPSTIEALQTLTTLSLTRPEAFKYGVLATDKIPGLLLYGPPGTGKTLLAKAVAKQSRATVLEVSGSDVFEMFVGEGEKNVRAIFTLARKLSPCIVFIDEADAIFGARSSHSSRTSHRELINQFLREWDGMSSNSNEAAFIMVATNRPFDLDDAVLRRLPRRILVDLPTQADRHAILKIHLKDEVLAPDVDLSKLATETPFYSGSDLKNLSVAAALACVRDENAVAAKAIEAIALARLNAINDLEESTSNTQHDADVEEYVYPTRRTITKAHFDVAMTEISASISEDMSSLTAIRKFDEKYGDKAGKDKKKSKPWGFGKIDEAAKEEKGRVRI
jgi:SpoVK/Ycf46/Vps4 family AAA+-type ATPase